MEYIIWFIFGRFSQISGIDENFRTTENAVSENDFSCGFAETKRSRLPVKAAPK